MQILKKLSKKSLLILFFPTIFIFGCEIIPEPTLPPEYLLTYHTWNFDGISTNSVEMDAKTLVILMSEFYEGGTIDFDTTGIYVFSANNTQDVGTWELSEDQDSICFDMGTWGHLITPIVKLTKNKLEYKQNIQLKNGKNFDVMWTWTRTIF